MYLENHYLPVAFSEDIVEGKTWQFTFHDAPYFLLRNKGEVYAYRDYCPHRGAPLSKGIFEAGSIHCPYHGWEFDCKNGENVHVPVKNKSLPCKLISAKVAEKYGLIWISKQEKAIMPILTENEDTFKFTGEIHAQLANVLENFLEGSHTHYIHNGLIRTQNKNRTVIRARFIPNENGFEVHYEGEKQKGLVNWLTPKPFQQLHSVAKYIFPSTAILQYFDANKRLVAQFKGMLKPQNDKIVYFASIYINIGFLTPFATLLGKYLFKKIVRQDKKILEIQQKNLTINKDLRFYSDDNTDLIGKQIYCWLYKPADVLKEERILEFYL